MQPLIFALVLIFGLMAAGCHDPTNPVAPSPPAAPMAAATPDVPTLILSGLVSEDGQPIENAHVQVHATQPCSGGCSFRQFNAGYGMTDASGRYRILVMRPEETTATVWVLARKDGYAQQCVATTTMQTDATLDVRVTSIGNLHTTRPLSSPGTRTISGSVFEVTSAGKHPVEGARVGWDAFMDSIVVETMSDAAGRYLLCGLPMERIDGLFAIKVGYSGISYASAAAGTDGVVDIEITRR